MSEHKKTSPAAGAKKGGDAHGVHAEPEAAKAAIISHDERLELSAEPRYEPLEGSEGNSVRQQIRLIGFNGLLILVGFILKLREGEWTWMSALYLAMIAKGVIRLVKFSWGFTPVGTDEVVFIRRNKEVLPKYWTKGWIEAKMFFDTTEAVSTKERPNTVVVTGFTKGRERVMMMLLCPVKPDFTIVEEDGVPHYVHLMHKGDGVVAAIQARVNASIQSWGGKLLSAFTKDELDNDPILWIKLCEAYGRLSLEMCRDMGLELNADADTIAQWGRENREKLIVALASQEAATEPSELERLTGQVFQAGWSAPEPQFTDAVMEAGEAAAIAKGDAEAVDEMEKVRARVAARATEEGRNMGLEKAALATYVNAQIAASLGGAGRIDVTGQVGGRVTDEVVNNAILDESKAATGGGGRRRRRR